MERDVEILILGPIEVREAGHSVPVGGLGAKVLCALLMGVNHSVSVDQVAWTVWGDIPPPSASASIQTYVYRLRGLLGADAIPKTDHGYELVASCDQIDSCRFERMVSAAEQELDEDPERSRTLCRDALGLWRGPPFGELASEEFTQLEAIRLMELRMNAVEFEIDAELRTGREREAVARLQALAREQPMRERFWHLLVRGLAAVDRRPEAVAAFDRYAEMLGESGLEPGISLEELLAS